VYSGVLDDAHHLDLSLYGFERLPNLSNLTALKKLDVEGGNFNDADFEYLPASIEDLSIGSRNEITFIALPRSLRNLYA
jgi:hypothetical protein